MTSAILSGDPLAPGHASGRLCTLAPRSGLVRRSETSTSDPSREVERFRQQVDVLEEEIRGTVERLESDCFRGEADILRAHLAMLRDPELHDQVRDLIHDMRFRAEAAVEQVLEAMAKMLAGARDPVLAERATDFRDLAMRLAAGLSDQREYDLEAVVDGSQTCILALPELLPSLVLEARELGVVGFIVECGTPLSHAAILAKSFGMPIVRVPEVASFQSHMGRQVLVRTDGSILIDPTQEEISEGKPTPETGLSLPFAEGTRIGRIWVSIVEPTQLAAVEWAGIEGVGLYRSETLFMRHRHDFPDEREQFLAYRRLFELAGNRPVVFRTLDLGADKPVEHMRLGPQENPCLGLRAHRLFHYHPEILVTQLRAVLRAARGEHRLRLMFPMIESIDELRFVRDLVDRAVASLDGEGTQFQRDFRQGVLIETPSAVWDFERLLAEVDFASIGTNDLVQYLFAVERNAVNVADFYQPAHPIVLRIIADLARKAADVGKPLGICGEVAADEDLLPVLVGLGLRDFSIAPGESSRVTAHLRALNEDTCTQLAQRCLAALTAEEVLSLIGKQPSGRDAASSTQRGEAVDPVCGMRVQTDDTPYVLHAADGIHYFCSRQCLRGFERRGNDKQSLG